MKELELLAPAKNLECGIEAIKCGADAVYIGASSFGARVSAGNSLDDIQKLVEYAAKFRAKVYVTINTILKNEELLIVEKLIHNLYSIGVNAIIIQDFGILKLDLPDIDIFASTQMHNNSLEKIKFLESQNFKRVILPREFSLDDIKKVKKETNIALESFIHGALCVSYSGQCYLSYAIGKRSANRGECAQPCRKKYSLIDSNDNIIAKDKYLLSLKDLNQSENLEALINAGVTSFKIEGRLKDINYVRNVVSYYRKKLDLIIEKNEYKRTSIGKSEIDFTPDLTKTFNRGYTDYFTNGRKNDIACIQSPKNIGETIGTVKEVTAKGFYIDSKKELHNGDGISFFKDGELVGTTINKLEKNLIYPKDKNIVKKGDFIYRNYDHSFFKKLENAKISRKIGLTGYIYNEKANLVIKFTDEENISAELKIKNNFEPAENKDKAVENIKKQLSKLGETDFYMSDLQIKLDNISFIPIKELNEFRRKAIELLCIERNKFNNKKATKITSKPIPYPLKELNYTANVLNSKAEKFYKQNGIENLEPAAESGLDMRKKTVMTTKHCLKYHFNMCSKQKMKNDFKEPFYLVDEKGKKCLLKFNCKNCQMEIIF